MGHPVGGIPPPHARTGEGALSSLGLTPMESRVAVLLTEGKSLREVAAATGRKETTIRWHLRQIFAKRGIARQAELVRLVLSLAGAAHVRR